MKVCTKCWVEKKDSAFFIRKDSIGGLRAHCKECTRLAHVLYNVEHQGEIRLQMQGYRHRNAEKRRQKDKEWRAKNPGHMREYHQRYRIKNADKLRKYWRSYRTRRLFSDPQFRLAQYCRTRVNSTVRERYKSAPTLVLLGCSLDELKTHLEAQFQPGMTWKTHGQFGWHIDHIIPCARFNLTDPEQQRQCFHYTNLQPLWWRDNLAKGAK